MAQYIHIPVEWRARALRCARGAYQCRVVRGHADVTGAALRGRARHWGSRYAQSVERLLHRLNAAGIPWTVRGGAADRGRVSGQVRWAYACRPPEAVALLDAAAGCRSGSMGSQEVAHA